MRQRILLASGNEKKLAELRVLCEGLPLELLVPSDLPEGLPEVVEDGRTFFDNAVKKAFAAAEAAAAQLGGAAVRGGRGEGGARAARAVDEGEIWGLADDSGLCVDALDGAPGVLSARYSGVEGEERDASNNEFLLEQLDGLPADRRGASFWCVLAVARPDELLFAVEGSVEGGILDAPDGEGGFGYDPLFYHEASGCSFARLSREEKAAVSHRGQAFAKLRAVLETILSSPSA